MLDKIGSSHMVQGSLTSFISDRFGRPNSALALNGGWTQVPSGVYFDTLEFTISVWVLPQQIGYYARLIDFGNGAGLDNLIFSLSDQFSMQPYFGVMFESNLIFTQISPQKLILGEWQFLAVTFNGNNLRFYLNGTLFINFNYTYTLPSLTRTNCYIGQSNWPNPPWYDGYSFSYLDELRFFNKSLTQDEIINLMNVQNETSEF
jgi:hypothetical protein